MLQSPANSVITKATSVHDVVTEAGRRQRIGTDLIGVVKANVVIDGSSGGSRRRGNIGTRLHWGRLVEARLSPRITG